MIRDNLKNINRSIEYYAQQRKEFTFPVKLLAVSKTKPVEAIQQAFVAGQQAFGENYVQEAIEKIQFFEAKNIYLEWHFIGPLQSNKTKLIAEYFTWVESIDCIKIAKRLNEQRPKNKTPLNVLIQINISHEASKSGVSPSELTQLATEICQLPQLRLRGLMAIPEINTENNEEHRSFEKMYQLYQNLVEQFPNEQIDTLSMGMSQDMQAAILAGSTQVRIGTALFGSRNR